METPTKLALLWSTADREVALHPIFMYAHNGKKLAWWEEVVLIIWGPSVNLLTQDEELQEKIKAMIQVGVKVKACRNCADSYDATEALERLGVEVDYMGQPLTAMLKDGWATLTY